MVKKWHTWLGLAGLASGLGLASPAPGQTTPLQPLKNLFGSRTSASEAKANQHRATEIQVEMAWLSDPTTFPYYLEAHVKGTTLEVHGFVPSQAVRQQALNLAKLNCSLAVADVMKQHALLTVHPTTRSPAQLQSAVQIALMESFPRQNLAVNARPDGTVEITGTVRSLEQKLAVSQALRRLHGCSGVTNATQVEGTDAIRQPAPSTAKVSPAPADQTAKTTVPDKRGGVFGMFGKAPAQAQPKQAEPPPVKITTLDTSTPPVKASEPGDSRGVIVVSGSDAKDASAGPVIPSVVPPATKAAPAATASAAQLKKSIEGGIPGIRNVVVTFTSKTDVRVECTLRPSDDTATIAGQILSLPALNDYKVDLQVKVPAADQK